MWKKRGCQRRKTELMGEEKIVHVSEGANARNMAIVCKSSGKVEIVMGMFAFLLVLIVMLFGLKISQFMITGAYVEDALAASNLASALIDVEEYGRNYTIKIAEPQEAFEIYREALAVNLKLDEEGKSIQRELLAGPVKILSYIVYNVTGDHTEIYFFDGNGCLEDTQTAVVGQVLTPDGKLVETTTIYSKVEFAVQGIGQQFVTVRKEKSVDIKRR